MKLNRIKRAGCGLMGAYLVVAIVVNGIWLLNQLRKPKVHDYYSPIAMVTSYSDCRNGSCSASAFDSSGYVWRFTYDAGPWELVLNGQVIGSLGTDGVYRDKAGKEIDCPAEFVLDSQKSAANIAKQRTNKPGEMTNFGLDVTKLGNAPQARLRNQPISREQAMQLIEDGIPDSNRRRIVVIGTPAERKPVMDQIRGEFAGVVGDVIVQEYDRGDWQVKDAGFVTTGQPTIYGLEPDGKVIFRQDDAFGLQKNIEQLRKPDPNYDPRKDADGRKTVSSEDSTYMIVGLVVVLLVLFAVLPTQKKESDPDAV